jgi:hypothetical protein
MLATHLAANLPEVCILYVRHEQPLRNIVHIASVMGRRTLVSLADVLGDADKVLIIELALTTVESCMVQRAAREVVVVTLTSRVGDERVYASVQECV